MDGLSLRVLHGQKEGICANSNAERSGVGKVKCRPALGSTAKKTLAVPRRSYSLSRLASRPGAAGEAGRRFGMQGDRTSRPGTPPVARDHMVFHTFSGLDEPYFSMSSMSQNISDWNCFIRIFLGGQRPSRLRLFPSAAKTCPKCSGRASLKLGGDLRQSRVMLAAPLACY